MSGTDRFAKLEELFHAASALPSEQRARFVAEECAPEFRAELDALLRSDSRGGAFVDDPGNAHGHMRRSMPDPMLGERVGAFRLVERIAEGGMGVVYRATREDGAFSQQVAVKLMRGGLVTERQLRRFEHERRLLARLAHPNIARLYDGGTTERGAPYLAMEFIHGAPIDVYCDHEHLSIAERVKLFVAVCDAVHFAHQNLVIHRDLKPSNVLVDTSGQPKLLDFGVAKLVAQDDAGERATETIARVFTPEYASPEQFSGTPLTTATDIYSLGVMLHVLLTGVKPFEAAGLSDPAFSRVVREREAARPSTFASSLRGDLDRILLMALRKEPERRYASAERFASDLRRWALGLPVMARPDTFAYRTTKFLRRNWLAVSLSTLAVTSLVGGLVVALHLRDVAERERNEVTAERDHVRLEMKSGAETIQYLMSTFVDQRERTAAERAAVRASVLARAEHVRSEFATQPHQRANLLDMLGLVCSRLGLYDDAETLMREAYATRIATFGSRTLEVTLSLSSLGKLAYDRGWFEVAAEAFARALELQRALPVNVDTDVALAVHHLAMAMERLGHIEDAKALYAEAIEIRTATLGADAAETLESKAALATLLAQPNK